MHYWLLPYNLLQFYLCMQLKQAISNSLYVNIKEDYKALFGESYICECSQNRSLKYNKIILFKENSILPLWNKRLVGTVPLGKNINAEQ